MANEKRRGNRETRKPKAVKAPVSAPAPLIIGKGVASPANPPKRKG